MKFDLIHPPVGQLGRRGNRLLEAAVKNAIGSEALANYFANGRGASEDD